MFFHRSIKRKYKFNKTSKSQKVKHIRTHFPFLSVPKKKVRNFFLMIYIVKSALRNPSDRRHFYRKFIVDW